MNFPLESVVGLTLLFANEEYGITMWTYSYRDGNAIMKIFSDNKEIEIKLFTKENTWKWEDKVNNWLHFNGYSHLCERVPAPIVDEINDIW